MEFNQENFDKLLSENAELKTEATNKATALKAERDEHKATKTALAETAKAKEDLATKAATLESTVTVLTWEKTKFEEENKSLSSFKTEMEAKAQADKDAKTAKVTELQTWFTENKKDINQTVFDALGDNLDAKTAYLENLKNINTPGYKAVPATPSDPAEGKTDYQKASETGDVKSMIANAPVIATID